jgi:isopenicillin-N N-acyltransferase-like protein
MEDGRACSANYLIAQSPASAVNLESTPSVVSPSEHDWPHGCLVHTNHFVDPDSLGVTEPPDEYRIFSHLRRERLQAMLRRNRPLRMKDLMRYLSDHANAPRSICRHEEPDASIDEQYRTVTSIVMDLHEGTLLASDGPPCVNHYDRYSLADKESPG